MIFWYTDNQINDFLISGMSLIINENHVAKKNGLFMDMLWCIDPILYKFIKNDTIMWKDLQITINKNRNWKEGYTFNTIWINIVRMDIENLVKENLNVNTTLLNIYNLILFLYNSKVKSLRNRKWL